MQTITLETLKEFMHYDDASDSWTRVKAHKMRPDRAGKPAGYMDGGYLNIKIGSAKYKAHRLVWLWHHGTMPTGHIDHIDGDTLNNRIENLRDVPRSINAQNQRSAHTNNKTGYLGVHSTNVGYVARLSLSGRRIYLGTYRSAADAFAAYVLAKRKLHPGCTI